MKNEPYIKEYNEFGQCTNPVEVAYYHFFDNRRKRRAERYPNRFHGNKKGVSLTVSHVGKYKRVLQHETTKDGLRKVIEHYILQ